MECKAKSKKFNVMYNDLNLEFIFYNKEFILSKLKEYEGSKSISSVRCVYIPEMRNRYSELKNEYIDIQGKEKYHFFAYIKFFEYDGEKYGLVGGKTNYRQPDITFDYLEKIDNRIARTFLNANNLNWSREIIVVNHSQFAKRDVDEKQALFLECFLQREFNLFNS